VKPVWIIVLALAAGVARATGTPAADSEWKPLGTQDGVTVFRKEDPATGVYALKGTGTVDASVPRLLTVLRDLPRQKEWVDRLKDARFVRGTTPFERVIYTRFGLPWPIKDRDFVLETRTTFDRATNTVHYEAHSIEDPLLPVDKCCVRGEVRYSRVTLALVDDGKKTKIESEVLVDPKGGIPKWAVNLVQKSLPRKSIAGLLKQVAKPDVAESADVTALLK
jgi:hypothetical protein